MIFWIALTIIVFYASLKLKQIRGFKKVPPILISACVIICVLYLSKTSYATYNEGAHYLTMMLMPATIALALPLIENFDLIRNNKRAVIFGSLTATVIGVGSVIIISKLLKASNSILFSMIPKSITTPIAIEVSKTLGGIPALTACVVVLTGLFGGLIGHRLLKLFKIKHNLSIGLAIGACSHVLGTSRCIEKGEAEQSAISGLSIIIVAIMTAVLAPVLIKLF